MAQQSALELHKLAAETTAKYIYFLLATSGAAIAYSVELADPSKLSWSLLLLVLALLSWGVSFYAGCRSLQFNISVHNLSFEARQVTENIETGQKKLEPQYFNELREGQEDYVHVINKALNAHETKASSYLILQFRLFITGVVLFVLWRATEFIINAVSHYPCK
ncbi:MAG: hypothetical protein KDF59_16605 [Nitrosomonas sp.]|nr:hypothetical protein [Nitrosomonas sp.]